MASGDLSMTSMSSQEEESSEYAGYEQTLRPPSNSSGSTSATANMANNNPNSSNNNNNNNGSNNTTTNPKIFDVIKTQYDSALIELTKLRHQHSDTVRRCVDLESQLAFYRDQYCEAMNQLKHSDRNKFSDIFSENERLKQENSMLQNKLQSNAYYCDYNDVGGTQRSNKCDGTCAEAEKLTSLIKEHTIVAGEREKYKKNLNAAFMELDSLKKERFFRDTLREENQKLKLLLTKESKNVTMITEELNQLLSEKDNVLQEHQKMSDDLAAANKELEKYKKDELIYKNEIKSLQLANSELKKRDLLKSRESSWSKEFADSKEDAKELEKLRKSLEKAQLEVERLVQDTEEAKRVRDWASSQRDKIVQERDSVKTLCDNLRKERDKAISDLLSAIRDSEKIKKQKDEAQKKIDALKEQLENQNHLDNGSRRSFRMSAYEAEDMLDVELSNYHGDSDLGIIVDDTHNKQLVCGVTNISPAFGKLKINDVICKVNNLDCQNLSKRVVLDEIRASAPRCNLLIARTRNSKRHLYTVHLNVHDNPNHGLHVDNGVFISKIESNSLAAFEPELAVGDRILSINNKSMEGMQSVDDVMQLLNDERNETITIFALKNVQDNGYEDGQRRMTTSSAQTDSIDSMNRLTNAKHPSKIAEMLSKFKEKMHISKPITDADQEEAMAVFDSVLVENSNEKSKRKTRSKKENEKAAKSMGTWPRTTFLQTTHENPTGTIVQRDKKRAPLSLFTAAPINVDKDDEHDERNASDELPPPLPPQSKPLQLANLRNGKSSAIKMNPNRNSNPIPASVLFQTQTSNMMGVVGVAGVGNTAGSNGGGGGYPNYARHSVYAPTTPMEQESLVLEQAKPVQRYAPIPQMRNKMPTSHANHQNRYSLNTDNYKTTGQQAQQQVINGHEFLGRKQHLNDMFTSSNQQYSNSSSSSASKHIPPSGLFVPLQTHSRNNGMTMQQQQQQQHQQNSLDMLSLRSQNSMDSILSAKSPQISEYTLPSYQKRGGMPMPQAATQSTQSGKNVAKYPSDSESIASGILSGGSYHISNNISNRHTQLFPTFTQAASHPHSHAHAHRPIRHPSPLTLPSPPPFMQTTHSSGNAHSAHMDGAIGIPTSSVDKFDLDYASPGHNHHHPGSYMQDYSGVTGPSSTQTQHSSHYHPLSAGVTSGAGISSGGMYEGGTFPRKKDHQRFRIPSNQSVASKNSGVKNSSGSIDHYTVLPSSAQAVVNMSSSMHHHSAVASVAASAANGSGSGSGGRGSPMPQVHVEVLSHGGSKRNSNVPADFLCPGDLRRVTIEKSDKSLGITIQCNNNGGGIFVSTVAEKSIATRAGLQVGDQLLEVCGLNMRSATNDIAANVLRQCGNSITMLVQYNPEKFHSAEYDGTNNLEPESPVNHSGSPTPRNSPRPPVRNTMTSLPPLPIIPPSSNAHPTSPLLPQANSSLLSTQSIKDQSSFADSLENQSDMSSSQDMPSSAATTTTATASTSSTVYEEESHVRYVELRMDKSKNLGIKLFGGNQVGIFVHDVAPGSPSDHAGILKGDQILEYNGVDLRCVTAEQAANEISKLTDTVTMLVQNKLKKLKLIKDKSGDSFYIRVGFDRTGDLNEGDLRFVKDEVLYVDNTVFNGQFGLWRAWKLDAKGHRRECGIIPSQMKVEEELRSGEVVDCESGTARRGSTSARRSFFRRKKHQRSSSRDSTEIASFSNTQLSFFPDSGILNDDGGILSYQRVEPVDSPVRRPVLIIGPLSEYVMDRLTMDFSNLFKLCEVTSMGCSQDVMDEGLQKNIFVDYRRRGNKFECTTVEAISNACKNDRRHCILDISISAVERLQRLQIYPIVLLLRFKSAKQIREIRDFGTDKISAKAAKEMYERALKLETDYKQYISAVIPGVSIKHMCTKIKDSVDKEQDKLLWVPVNN